MLAVSMCSAIRCGWTADASLIITMYLRNSNVQYTSVLLVLGQGTIPCVIELCQCHMQRMQQQVRPLTPEENDVDVRREMLQMGQCPIPVVNLRFGAKIGTASCCLRVHCRRSCLHDKQDDSRLLATR